MKHDAYTLRDLRALALRYIPPVSLHPNADRSRSHSWWWAHELGHLLVASRSEIGQPMFGFDIDDGVDECDLATSNRARAVECAAMTISRKLLRAAGRENLADIEEEETDHTTVTWGFYNERRIQNLLRRRGAAYIPRTLSGLRRLIQRKLDVTW